MLKNTLTSNDQSRKIPEQLPELVGARKPNQVFKTSNNIFMNKMIGKQLILQKVGFGAMYPSVLPSPSTVFQKLIMLILQIYPNKQNNRMQNSKKATISAHTYTCTNHLYF